jgi:MFS transporter, putative metabolite:H+ symporter
LRVLAGFGTGAESAIIAPYLAEFVGKRYRGKFTVALAGFFSFGYVLAALLGYFIIGQNWGSYKTLLIVTALPVLMVLWWRRMLPESPRWLVSHGRIAEAETAVARIEAEVQQAGHTLEPPVPSTAPAPEQAGGTIWTNLSTLWSPGLARTTAMCWFLWIAMAFSYYAFFTWLPSLLVQSGMTIAKSFGFSLAIYSAQVPGYFSAAFLSERLGRRALIACYATSGALSAGALALATSETQIIVAAMALSFSMNGAFGGLYAYTSELFPTRVRATGMGTSSSVGRLGAIGAPILVGMIFPILGFAGVFAMTTVVLALGAFIVLVFGVHTKGRSLEEIEQEIPAVRAPAKNGESARE